MILMASWVLMLAQSPSPVPSAAEIKDAEKRLRDLIAGDLGARDREGRRNLAEKLLEQAAGVMDDQALRYTMLEQARELACLAADVGVAFRAVDRLAEAYDIKDEPLRTASLTRVRKEAVLPKDGFFIAAGLLEYAEGRLKAEDHDAAAKWAKEAELPARAVRAYALAARAKRIAIDAPKLRRECERVLPLLSATADAVPDAAASVEVGKYLCFVKNDWPKGLEHLRRGADKGLQAVVALEGNLKADAIDVAEAWWSLSRQEKAGLDRDRFMERAQFWAEKAWRGEGGVGKLKADRLLDEIEAATAPFPPIDLLALVDPRKDVVYGDWKRTGGGLDAPPLAPAQPFKIMLPYHPPEEYDVRFRLEAGPGAFGVGLVSADGTQFYVGAGGAEGVPLAARGPTLVVASVRRMHVILSVDGKRVWERLGDLPAAASANWSVPDTKALWIGCQGGVRFVGIKVIPLSGGGRKSR